MQDRFVRFCLFVVLKRKQLYSQPPACTVI
jgi:hypothetical protein